MKKFLFLFIFMILIINIKSEMLKLNSGLLSGFCDYKYNFFHTGIDIGGENKYVGSPISGELVYYNSNRNNSITYGNGNLLVIQEFKNNYRYIFSNLKENSINQNKIFYQKDDIVGVTGNSGFEEAQILHLEIQNVETKAFKNPLKFIKIDDTIPPVIEDVYFISEEKKISLADFRNFKIKRGGKLYVNCYDKINGNNSKLTPYKITVIIDGEEIALLKFDSMEKSDYDYVNQDGRSLKDIYSNNAEFDYYLVDFTSLPKVIGFKLIVEDYNGNIREFKRNLFIQF